MRDGANKLLQASKTTWQSMEASKGLFVSNAKIIALMKEVQQRQAAVTETRYRSISRGGTVVDFIGADSVFRQ